MENPDIPSDKKPFPCLHCGGTVLVPRDLPPTTAPCPYCGETITSPALETTSAAPPAAPVTATQASPALPHEPPPVPPPAVIEAMVQGPPPPAGPPPAKPEAIRKPEPELPAAPPARKKSSELKPEIPQKTGGFPVMLVSLLLLGGGVLTYFVTREMNREIPGPVAGPQAGTLAPADANYIRIGWQKDAARLLKDFLAADTCEGKLPFVLNSDALAPRMRNFYGEAAINDSDTPAAAFSIFELSEEDRRRGLFMMTYDQPPQFDMREFFRPLATLEVQYGMDEADLLLSTVARAGNFAMEPLRVHAFFKRTPAGLKLDWEIFAQTKYRTFRNFVELPEPGQTGVFRVFIAEDVPDPGLAGAGYRTYRLSDPAHTDDAARVNVLAGSEIGQTLKQINWRGTKDGNPLTRTATVELEWTEGEKTPRLQLRRFICWEFLGLGGEEHPTHASAK